MVGKGPPSTSYFCCDERRRGWPACAGHDAFAGSALAPALLLHSLLLDDIELLEPHQVLDLLARIHALLCGEAAERAGLADLREGPLHRGERDQDTGRRIDAR